MEDNKKNGQLSDKKLRSLIWEHINMHTVSDKLTLTLPWYFDGGDGAPLEITIKHVKPPKKSDGPLRQKYGGSVDTEKHESYEISDGGRAIAELERKVGDISPYASVIERVLYKTGMHSLRGGRIITKIYDLYSPWITVHELDGFITAITVISNLDIMPTHTKSKWSRDCEESSI